MVSDSTLGGYEVNGNANTFLFTEWLIFIALFLTYLIANGDLIRLNLQQSLLKHAGGLTIVAACLLDFSGRRLFSTHAERHIGNTSVYWVPLLTLAFFITVGSLYARIELDIQDTFLILGIYIFVGWSFSLSLSAGNTKRIISLLFWFSLSFACIVCISTIANRALDLSIRDTAIHEREFFVIPLLYLLFFTRRVIGIWRWLCVGLILGASIAAMKNTPTLVLALTLIVSIFRWKYGHTTHAIDRTRKIAMIYLSTIIFILIALGGLTYVEYVKDITPKDNITFRQHQYSAAWQQFLESPIIGNSFTGSSGIEFFLWKDINLGSNLPTHNDVLDILRAGGAIGFMLWFFPLFVVFSKAIRILRKQASQRIWMDSHDTIAWLLLSNISAVIVYFFNPLLSKTAFATIVWIFGASLAALVLIRPLNEKK